MMLPIVAFGSSVIYQAAEDDSIGNLLKGGGFAVVVAVIVGAFAWLNSKSSAAKSIGEGATELVEGVRTEIKEIKADRDDIKARCNRCEERVILAEQRAEVAEKRADVAEKRADRNDRTNSALIDAWVAALPLLAADAEETKYLRATIRVARQSRYEDVD